MNNPPLRHLVTFGAAAVATGLPVDPASAQTAASALDGYTLTVDGGLAFADYSDDRFDFKGGDFPKLDRDKGFFGSVAISRQISDVWDWRVSGMILSFQENNFVTSDPSNPASFFAADQQAKTITADVDIGRLIKSGKTDIRLGLGLLAGRHQRDEDIELRFGAPGKGVGFGDDIDYRGIGVKLSADLAHPVSKDGRIKLIGGASVAPTRGTYTLSSRGFIDLGMGVTGGSTSVDEDGEAVFSSAYLGLSYQRSETSELRFGLRADRFDGDTDVIGDANDLTSTTAFVGLRIQF